MKEDHEPLLSRKFDIHNSGVRDIYSIMLVMYNVRCNDENFVPWKFKNHYLIKPKKEFLF